jgi:DNA-binding cell septation regulator SpoVG
VTAIGVRDVVRTTDPTSKVKLTATVVLGGVTIRFVRLVEGQRGPFVGLPSRKVGDSEFLDVVELSEGLRGRVRDALLGAMRTTPVAADDDLPF